VFITRIIELIFNRNTSIVRGPLDLESITDVKAFIETKISK
jgi:hypothetical protein